MGAWQFYAIIAAIALAPEVFRVREKAICPARPS